MIHNYIGWIGAFFFAICAVPQVIKTWKTKKADDLSWLFLLFWLLGELFTFTYIIADDLLFGITHYPLYVNYAFNRKNSPQLAAGLFIIVMIFYLIYAKRFY